jgi:hypothetical protein
MGHPRKNAAAVVTTSTVTTAPSTIVNEKGEEMVLSGTDLSVGVVNGTAYLLDDSGKFYFLEDRGKVKNADAPTAEEVELLAIKYMPVPVPRLPIPGEMVFMNDGSSLMIETIEKNASVVVDGNTVTIEEFICLKPMASPKESIRVEENVRYVVESFPRFSWLFSFDDGIWTERSVRDHIGIYFSNFLAVYGSDDFAKNIKKLGVVLDKNNAIARLKEFCSSLYEMKSPFVETSVIEEKLPPPAFKSY